MAFKVNDRTYDPQNRPLVVICLDGSADEYLDAALDRDLMPNLRRMAISGYRGLARGALPSFTNVNNAAIVTGAPPSVTGISGNYFLDPETGQEVMMNEASYLRCPTILAEAARNGRRVAAVTAKNKLLEILAKDLDGVSVSAERAGEIDLSDHEIKSVPDLVGDAPPEIYSADASLFVLRTGVALLEQGHSDFLYLSTTDYIQHSFAHDEQNALDFYASVDLELGQLVSAGAVVAITADHGMNAKQRPDGSPNVIYLETLLQKAFGDGVNVLLPITDPYVVHHGALGSFATVHLSATLDAATVGAKMAEIDGITEVLSHENAVRSLKLPADRIGDLVVMSGRDVVIGKTPEHHDLSVLEGVLRSHGGRFEETVPLIVSAALSPSGRTRVGGDVRNYDIFDLICNGLENEVWNER